MSLSDSDNASRVAARAAQAPGASGAPPIPPRPRCACGASLVGLAITGQCPQCGKPFDRASVASAPPTQPSNQTQEWRWWDLRPTRRLPTKALRNPRCRRCDYPLRTDAIVGYCPECGAPYDKGNAFSVRHDDEATPTAGDVGDMLGSWRHVAVMVIIAVWILAMIMVFAGPIWTLASAFVGAVCVVLWLYATDRLSFDMTRESSPDEDEAAQAD